MSRSRRESAAVLLTSRPIGTVARRLARWQGVIVLNYHRVGDSAGEPWDRTLWNVDAETFDRQLATLAEHADVITPQQALALADEPRPGRHVLLTFDDGYRDNYEVVFPLLRRHGLPATFFVASGFLDEQRVAWWDELAWMVHRASRPTLASGPWAATPLPLGARADSTVATVVEHYKTLASTETEAYLDRVAEATGSGRCAASDAGSLWMTWEMLRELHGAGMSIGGHTVTHPILARVSPDRQLSEIAGCRSRLREELAIEMDWFAYPVGSRDAFTEETKRLLGEQRVRLAFSFYGGYAHPGAWDPFDVPRVHIGPRHGPGTLRAMLLLPQLFTRP